MLKTSSLWVGEFGYWLLATSTNNTFYYLLWHEASSAARSSTNLGNLRIKL
jgi:hypothetical protein